MLTTDRYVNAKEVRELYSKLPFPRPLILKKEYAKTLRSPKYPNKLRENIDRKVNRTGDLFLKKLGFDFSLYKSKPNLRNSRSYDYR